MKSNEAQIVQAKDARLRFIPFDNGQAALDIIASRGDSGFTNISREQAIELRDLLTEWVGDSQSQTEDKALIDFIATTERTIFRTEHDIGANINSLIIWNRVRSHAGLPWLDKEDLTTAEEYSDRTCDVISEREYPLMPRSQSPYLRARV